MSEDILLQQILEELKEIKEVLQSDRDNMWKILAMAILGSFALVGIKLMFP